MGFIQHSNAFYEFFPKKSDWLTSPWAISTIYFACGWTVRDTKSSLHIFFFSFNFVMKKLPQTTKDWNLRNLIKLPRQFFLMLEDFPAACFCFVETNTHHIIIFVWNNSFTRWCPSYSQEEKATKFCLKRANNNFWWCLSFYDYENLMYEKRFLFGDAVLRKRENYGLLRWCSVWGKRCKVMISLPYFMILYGMITD